MRHLLGKESRISQLIEVSEPFSILIRSVCSDIALEVLMMINILERFAFAIVFYKNGEPNCGVFCLLAFMMHKKVAP